MPKPMRTSKVGGMSPPGSARPVRNKPDLLAATDTPVEVPVYVYYERHIGKPATGKARGSGKLLKDMPKARQLLGWTITVNCFSFDKDIKIKVGHNSDVLSIWLGDEKLGTVKGKVPAGSRNVPPNTLPSFSNRTIEDDSIEPDDLLDDDFEEE